MSHYHLRFDLLDRFKGNALNDKQRRTADLHSLYTENYTYNQRQNGNYSEEYSAYEIQP